MKQDQIKNLLTTRSVMFGILVGVFTSPRDSSKIVHLFGTLLSNVPGYNGSQVQVDRIEIEE
jgi:hypothetical protein